MTSVMDAASAKTDRPTDVELGLDSVDEVYKAVVAQLYKDLLEGAPIDVPAAIERAKTKRMEMIAFVSRQRP